MIFLLESPGGKHKTKVSIKNGEPFVLEVLTRIERVTEEPNGDYLEITEDFYQDFVLDKSMVEAWLKEIKKHPDFAGYFKGGNKMSTNNDWRIQCINQGKEVLATLDTNQRVKFLKYNAGSIDFVTLDEKIQVHFICPEQINDLPAGVTLGEILREDNITLYSKEGEVHYFVVYETKDVEYQDPGFIGRLEIEIGELNLRNQKLGNFLKTPDFEKLEEWARYFLKAQYETQKTLHEYLKIRYDGIHGETITLENLKMVKSPLVDDVEVALDKLLELKQQYDFTFLGSPKFHNQLEPLRVQIEIIKQKIIGSL